eukprot:TRINITY_DN4410_c0_g1_i3.p1 TRINITY_DN4410_c0_g1~~TRINITY_DN4410_c0_g1_i3.p1  ORF type:complete len:370 (+),score=100.33 TRINITY_DN4410_c0_g1_i3:341-1450(+)
MELCDEAISGSASSGGEWGGGQAADMSGHEESKASGRESTQVNEGESMQVQEEEEKGRGGGRGGCTPYERVQRSRLECLQRRRREGQVQCGVAAAKCLQSLARSTRVVFECMRRSYLLPLLPQIFRRRAMHPSILCACLKMLCNLLQPISDIKQTVLQWDTLLRRIVAWALHVEAPPHPHMSAVSLAILNNILLKASHDTVAKMLTMMDLQEVLRVGQEGDRDTKKHVMSLLQNLFAADISLDQVGQDRLQSVLSLAEDVLDCGVEQEEAASLALNVASNALARGFVDGSAIVARHRLMDHALQCVKDKSTALRKSGVWIIYSLLISGIEPDDGATLKKLGFMEALHAAAEDDEADVSIRAEKCLLILK